MNGREYPSGWDAKRVKQLIDHYEQMSEDELVAEDEAGSKTTSQQTNITVPVELLPVIRQLLANHRPS
jgi:hypothetical protein